MIFKPQTTISGFTFHLLSATDGAAITTGAVSGYVTADGGVQTALLGAPVHEGGGQWSVIVSNLELAGSSFGLLFTHADAVSSHSTILSEARRNQPITGFPFLMVKASDGSPLTSGAVAGFVTKDGGVQASLSNSPTHKGNGQWTIDLTAEETDGDTLGLLFTSPGAIGAHFTLSTVLLAEPALSVVDDGDGGGATATISSSDAGSVNEIFTAPWSGGFFAPNWSSAATRSGDGGAVLALATGRYWAFVESSLGGASVASEPLGFVVTSGEDAIYQQCLDAVQATIQSLALPGLAGGNVVVRKLPWDRNLTKPAVIISPTNETVSPATNIRDDIAYGVQVTMLQSANQDLTANLSSALSWREQIAAAFRGQTLSGVNAVYVTRVEPDEVADRHAFSAQLDASALVIRCIARQSRGVT